MKSIRIFALSGALTAVLLAVGIAIASRNSSGTMSGISGPYTAGSVISSSVINARLADIETELTDSKSRSGKGDFSAPVRAADGVVTAPAFAFTSETGTGLYRIGSSDLGVSINQVKKLELTSSLFTVTPNMTASGTLAVTGASTFSDVISQSISGTGQTNMLSLFEPSLANGNLAVLWLGKSTSANAAGNLTYNPNGTAANSTFCAQVGGQTATLCVDGNNKTYIGSGGTGTTGVNFGSCALNSGTPATCTATVSSSGAKCQATLASAIAETARTLAVSVSGTTLTITSGTAGDAHTVNYLCFN